MKKPRIHLRFESDFGGGDYGVMLQQQQLQRLLMLEVSQTQKSMKLVEHLLRMIRIVHCMLQESPQMLLWLQLWYRSVRYSWMLRTLIEMKMGSEGILNLAIELFR